MADVISILTRGMVSGNPGMGLVSAGWVSGDSSALSSYSGISFSTVATGPVFSDDGRTDRSDDPIEDPRKYEAVDIDAQGRAVYAQSADVSMRVGAIDVAMAVGSVEVKFGVSSVEVETSQGSIEVMIAVTGKR